MKNKFLIVIIICILFNFTFGDNWTSWKGPNGNYISTETDWDPEALSGSPEILWEANVGKGHATVAIFNNYLYTTGNNQVITGSDTLNEDVIYCLDAETGDEIWTYSYPCKDRDWPGPRTSPVVDGKYLFVLGWEGDLFCLNSKTGKVIWRKHLINDGFSDENMWGFSGSPVIEGDMLILSANKSGVALNKHTGKVIWKSEKGIYSLTTPILFDYKGKRAAAIGEEKIMHVVDVETGNIIWSYEWKTCNDPVIFDNKMYLTAEHDRKSTRLLDISGDEPKIIWENRAVMNGWAFQNNVVYNGYSYSLGRVRTKQPLHCVDMATGEMKWQEVIGERWGGFSMANGKLLILSGEGKLIIADISPEGYKEISSAQVLTMSDNTGLREHRQCGCWTAPVLVNGKIYARDNFGHMVCVNMQQ